MLAEHTRFCRWTDQSRPTSTLQDEQLSHMFPLHNDKQQRRPSCEDDETKDVSGFWWSQTGSNRRPEACKATALPTELWPLLKSRVSRHEARRPVGLASPRARKNPARKWGTLYRTALDEWWAWEDLNLRPHAYQARALTN